MCIYVYIYICICVMCVYVCIYMYTDMYVFSNFLYMCEFLSNRATCMREVDDKWTISHIYILYKSILSPLDIINYKLTVSSNPTRLLQLACTFILCHI